VAAHTASGPILPIIDDLHQAGADAVCPSSWEDLADIKSACCGRMAVIGNLNGVEMRRWDHEMASARVKKAIYSGGPGGGFILADNHGEIPFQVPETILDAISASVYKYGWYPLK
jgi:uroporphyrinogen decarboxylase